MARNKYPEETTQKILEAALKIFLEKGYEKTTVLDIVSAMGGLTRGAFYHHFKSKEEVFDAVGDKLFFDNNPFEKAKLRTDLSGLEKLQELLASSLENTDVRKVNVMTIQVFTSPTLTNDVKNIEDNYLSPLLLCLLQCVAFVTSFIVMIYLSPIVTVCLLVTMFIVIIVPSLFNRSIQKKQDSFSKKQSHLTVAIKDFLSGFEVIRSYKMNDHIVSAFKKTNTRCSPLSTHSTRFWRLSKRFRQRSGSPSSAVSCSWQHI